MNEKFEGDIWECACGDGAMTQVLRQTGNPIISSDLYNRGFGEDGARLLNKHSARQQYYNEPAISQCRRFRSAMLRLSRG